MSRPLRIEYPGAYYHVMNRGRRRELIYKGRGDYQRFLDLLEETCTMQNERGSSTLYNQQKTDFEHNAMNLTLYAMEQKRILDQKGKERGQVLTSYNI